MKTTTMKTTAGVTCSCTLGEWRPAPNIAVGLVRSVQMLWDACRAYPHWRSDFGDCARWRSCIVYVCVYSKSIVDERRLLHAANAPRMQWDRIAVPAQVSAQFLIFVTRSQRCASTATGLNGNGRFNGTGTAVAPVYGAASAGSRCSCR